MSKHKGWMGLVLALLLPLAGAQAVLPEAEVSQRLQHLSKELRCLVCQNESLAESPASLADDLRNEVRAQIESGQSDEAIKAYLVARYGYFVIYQPPFMWRTLGLWLTPFLILFGLGGWLLYQLRRQQVQTTVSETVDGVDQADVAKAVAKIAKEFEGEQK